MFRTAISSLSKVRNHNFTRNFWKINDGVMKVHVMAVYETGFVFKHDSVVGSITKSAVNTGVGTNRVNLSLSKHMKPEDKQFFKDCMIDGLTPTVTYEQHLLGNPTEGSVLDPIYVTGIKNV